jgi:hypothetical protein
MNLSFRFSQNAIDRVDDCGVPNPVVLDCGPATLVSFSVIYPQCRGIP